MLSATSPVVMLHMGSDQSNIATQTISMDGCTSEKGLLTNLFGAIDSPGIVSSYTHARKVATCVSILHYYFNTMLCI